MSFEPSLIEFSLAISFRFPIALPLDELLMISLCLFRLKEPFWLVRL